ncbi:hypothetical protein M409DRAFT_61764 [Zasmidium cellare ATCC 36951]|uniref:Uncharacterized protein n=1 Tax=Zasmidium cellare ATCC 36951 TaxID=1080233 RepID=A0A6A6BU50_ZASCE|nr:uncharacterized protein M409DRAFT_61764 [Zasmidium cellare ATCC 36951]KAF2158317.1 hypothetical protein M409DRAFT_61764 [Zasmidium cellare ATCC 36951]
MSKSLPRPPLQGTTPPDQIHTRLELMVKMVSMGKTSECIGRHRHVVKRILQNRSKPVRAFWRAANAMSLSFPLRIGAALIRTPFTVDKHSTTASSWGHSQIRKAVDGFDSTTCSSEAPAFAFHDLEPSLPEDGSAELSIVNVHDSDISGYDGQHGADPSIEPHQDAAT